MSVRKRLLYFVCAYGAIALLLGLGLNAERIVDHIWNIVWLAVLFVGSAYVVFHRWPEAAKNENASELFYLGTLLPKSWRRWITDDNGSH